MFCENAYLIPLLPLLSFCWILGCGLARKWTRGDIRIADNTAALPSIVLVCGSWIWSIGVLLEVLQKGPGYAYHHAIPWLNAGFLDVHFGWLIDGMTAIMLIVVTTVGSMVQIFSKGYMEGDPRFPRFFAYLSLFTMAMLILVLANNLLQFFVAWELMGLASYLLIGFWFEKPSAMRAAKKAFMVTRVGDVGFFFGIALLLSLTGTLDFLGLVVARPDGTAPEVQTRGWIANLAVCAGPRIFDPGAPVLTKEAHGGGEHGGGGGEHGAGDAAASGTEHGASGGGEHAASPAGAAPAAGGGTVPAGEHSAATGAAAHGLPPGAGAHSNPSATAAAGLDPAQAAAAGHGLPASEAAHSSEPPSDPLSRGRTTPDDRKRAEHWVWLLALAALLIFCGSIGKSAQFPLHVWLPDAMEGPTPVSALIHAATMVAAGVYLVARMYPVFDMPGEQAWFGVMHFRPLDVVAWIGTFTALMSALIALTQPDIKRILAYSTCSQLGFMLAGLGCGGVKMHGEHQEFLQLGFTAGIFHLMTHAFFKGLLFLGSGSVIHGTGTQDVWEMGAIRRYMPKTTITYTLGYIALAGVPFVAAGFYSKDLILDAAYEAQPLIFWILLGTAGLTAFYMTRQMMLVFMGEWSGGPKNPADGHGSHGGGHATSHAPDDHGHAHDPHGSDDHGHSHDAHGHDAHAHAASTAHDAHGHTGGHDDSGGGHGGHGHHGEPHESGMLMVGPLMLLAVLAVCSGWVGFPAGVAAQLGMKDMGMKIFPFLHYERPGFHAEVHAAINPIVFIPGLIVPFIGIAAGWVLYRDRVFQPTKNRTPGGLGYALYRASLNKFYFDELYWQILIVPLFWITTIFKFMDIQIVDGVVRGAGWLGVRLADLWGWFDRTVVDGIVNLVGWISMRGGNVLRSLQTGQIQNYILLVFCGAMVFIALLIKNYLAP